MIEFNFIKTPFFVRLKFDNGQTIDDKYRKT